MTVPDRTAFRVRLRRAPLLIDECERLGRFPFLDAAFDIASQLIFRRAMQLSSGSIVRVEDLLMALHEVASEAATGIVPTNWQPPRRPASTAPWLTPMSNEPALRLLLEP